MNKYGLDMDFDLIFQVTRYLFRIFRVEKLICMKKPFMKVANTSNVENLVLHYFLKSTFTQFMNASRTTNVNFVVNVFL